MSTDSHEIRGVMIEIEGARLLLPNATISEVLSYAQPEALPDAPDWLLGRIRWRGWQLPLVSFSRLAGIAEDAGGLGSKVVVLKAFGGDSRLPFFALLTHGFPRLVTVSRDSLVTDGEDGAELPTGVRMRVLLNDDAAVVPDLAVVEDAIRAAIAA